MVRCKQYPARVSHCCPHPIYIYYKFYLISKITAQTKIMPLFRFHLNLLQTRHFSLLSMIYLPAHTKRSKASPQRFDIRFLNTLHALINISLRSTAFCDIYCNQNLTFFNYFSTSNLSFFAKAAQVLIQQGSNSSVTQGA